MSSRRCPHCSDSLPRVVDAYCPYCRERLDEEPLDYSEGPYSQSTVMGEPLHGLITVDIASRLPAVCVLCGLDADYTVRMRFGCRNMAKKTILAFILGRAFGFIPGFGALSDLVADDFHGERPLSILLPVCHLHVDHGQLALISGKRCGLRQVAISGVHLSFVSAVEDHLKAAWTDVAKQIGGVETTSARILRKQTTARDSADEFEVPSVEIMAGEILKQRGCFISVERGKISSVTGSEQLNDGDLASLINCQSLTNLDLQKSPITDCGMIHIGKIVSLCRLHLGHTSVTANGLVHLRSLQNLHSLDLTGTSILIDDAIEHLETVASLRWLDLRMTPKTEKSAAAIEYLRRRIPHLDFHPGGLP